MLNKKRAVFAFSLVALLILILLSFSIVFAKSEKSEENNKVSSDPVCKQIKWAQNKITFDNATLELCKKMDEAKKKAIGKGKLKKIKGVGLSENRILEKQGQGTIKFKNSFDVDSEEVEEESGNANVYIGEGIVAINTDEVPE